MIEKPESRKMFRPIVPKVPLTGGTITDLPFRDTKQPAAVSVLGSDATAAHFTANETGYVLRRPETPDVDVHVTPLVSIHQQPLRRIRCRKEEYSRRL